MCANLVRLADDLKALEAAGCDELHFDIMDGMFVPNITLGADFIKAAKGCCGLPCAAHLMVTAPERYIDRFVEAGADTVTIHVEACRHPHRTLSQIRDAGAVPGIALNPATPLTRLDYLLEHADRVMLMAVDPGFAGQTLIPSVFERVRIMRENLAYRKSTARIAVDGNINVENAALLANFGARVLVLGTSSVFRKGSSGESLGEAFREFRTAVAAKRQVV